MLCYNSSLVAWAVVSLTAAKFKPLIFSMSGFTLSYTANMFILMILYDFCELHAAFNLPYVYEYITVYSCSICPLYTPLARTTVENPVSNCTSIVGGGLLPREPVCLRSLPRNGSTRCNTYFIAIHDYFFTKPQFI
jgi:hypothetical protein